MFEGWGAPSNTEIEVSVFGRGSGESILVHIGDGRWLVIDSFRCDGIAVPLIYLDAIGVDVARQVELVVASHWHDDHIHGLADTYRRAVNARMAFPLAMLNDEYGQFAAAYNNLVPAGKISSGVRELRNVMTILESRAWQGVEPANAWKTILRHNTGVLTHGESVVVEAMSPSNFDLVQFLGSLPHHRPPSNVAVRAPLYDRNDVSCALHIRVGDQAIALGADLETVADDRSGWDAVFGAQQFPNHQAGLLKIPHHGSATGHHPDIWAKLCKPEPVTSLSPWARGGGRLPKRTDVDRILGNAPSSYSAARTVTSGDRHRLQAVNSVLKRTNSRIRNVEQGLGHVRHRLDLRTAGSGWETTLFGTACELRKIAA